MFAGPVPWFAACVCAVCLAGCRRPATATVAPEESIPVESIVLDAAQPAILPLPACVEGQGLVASVFAVRRNANGSALAKRIQVELASLTSRGAALRTPLPAGTEIVTTGAEFLVDGSRITVVPHRAPSDP